MGTELRIAIAGCGHSARVHLDRLLALPGVVVVGCADTDETSARAMAARLPLAGSENPPVAAADHRELLRQTSPDALAIFTPHLAHYRPAMDALQAGCHVFIEKPFSTSVQEAVDVAGLARGRGRKVGIGHQFRLRPSLAEARRLLAEGAIGPVRLVTAVLAQPWLAAYSGPEDSWRNDPKCAGGVLADAGDHLLDALLWTTGQAAVEVAAVQGRLETGLDIVTAAAVRLGDGTPATVAVAGDTPGGLFELNYFGGSGRIRATDRSLEVETHGHWREVTLPEPSETIDGNFVAAVLTDAPLCCPADEALDTVRLLEAIGRSVASGQVTRLQ